MKTIFLFIIGLSYCLPIFIFADCKEAFVELHVGNRVFLVPGRDDANQVQIGDRTFLLPVRVEKLSGSSWVEVQRGNRVLSLSEEVFEKIYKNDLIELTIGDRVFLLPGRVGSNKVQIGDHVFLLPDRVEQLSGSSWVDVQGGNRLLRSLSLSEERFEKIGSNKVQIGDSVFLLPSRA